MASVRKRQKPENIWHSIARRLDIASLERPQDATAAILALAAERAAQIAELYQMPRGSAPDGR